MARLLPGNSRPYGEKLHSWEAPHFTAVLDTTNGLVGEFPPNDREDRGVLLPL